jgi:putative FmdB family regulatory protein
MPIYEYRCESCGKSFDFLAKRVSERPRSCPECGAGTLTKKLSTFSARVGNGSGGSASSSCPTGTCCPGGTCSLG